MRGKREEGRGKREEGRGKREEGLTRRRKDAKEEGGMLRGEVGDLGLGDLACGCGRG